MSAVKQLLANKHLRLIIVLGILGGIAALIIAWKLGVTPASLKSAWVDMSVFLKANPWAMFLALVFLPGLPVPMTALLLAAGAVWGANLQACLWMLLALALNMSWTYWIAAYPARGLIEKILSQTSIKIPNLPKNDHIRLILLLRLTPGLPLFIHNYILGFLRTPFWLYLSLSMLLSGAITSGILLTTGALLEGKMGMAIMGVMLIIVGAVAIKMLRAHLAKKENPNARPGITDPPAPLESSGSTDPAADI